MANHCYNHVTVSGISKENSKKLVEFLEDYENHSYMHHWVESFLPKHMHLTNGENTSENAYSYGGRWWDFKIESVEEGDETDTILIMGSSAWTPMTGLTQQLAKYLECHICHFYEEGGMDFAGEIEFDNEKMIINFDGTVDEFNYYERGIEGMWDSTEWLDGEGKDIILQFKKDWLAIVKEEDKKKVEEHFEELLKNAMDNEEEDGFDEEEFQWEDDDDLPI